MKSQEGYLTRKSGKWLGHYSRWIIDYGTGTRTRQQRAFVVGPVSGMTKTKAREKLRERMVKELGITADSRVTLSWFVEQRWQPMREGQWRDSTKQTNIELLKVITDRFGTVALEDMDGVAMQQWLNALAKKRSGSAVKHLRIFLRSIFAEATEQDHIKKNPARLLRVPKVKAVVRPYLTVEEVTALLKAARWFPRDHTLLTVMFVAPFRPSELFALKWRNFDGKAGTIMIAETIYRGKIRPYTKTTEEGDADHITMFLPTAARNALGQWHCESDRNAPDDYIFPNAKGGFITKENYTRRVLNVLTGMAGVPQVNFQTLRRTVATHAQSLGSPRDIATIMRHRKVETTQQHYIQMIEETVKETSEKLATKMLTPPPARKKPG